MEVLREFKSAQEIAFGCVLLGFVLFMPLGVASMARRYWPGWREDLHRRPRHEHEADAGAVETLPETLGAEGKRP
jgi:hypothetical protein